MPANHFILCHALRHLPSICSSELSLHIRWPKYWGFSFSISPSNEYSGLISFRIDWFDLLAIQGNFKSLQKQFKSINSLALSLLYGPALTPVQDYWKTTALTRGTPSLEKCLCFLKPFLGLSLLFFQGASIF